MSNVMAAASPPTGALDFARVNDPVLTEVNAANAAPADMAANDHGCFHGLETRLRADDEPLRGRCQMSSIDKQAREAAIRHLIAVRAYEMWENQGRPHGYDVFNWHQAEQEVMSGLAEDSAAREAAQAQPPRVSRR
jgi:Protein of unknown function (DUF2934)